MAARPRPPSPAPPWWPRRPLSFPPCPPSRIARSHMPLDRVDRDERFLAPLDDIDAILAVTNTDTTSRQHLVRADVDTAFTWDYERARPQLGKLYEKAKGAMWNATTDLDWSTPVD